MADVVSRSVEKGEYLASKISFHHFLSLLLIPISEQMAKVVILGAAGGIGQSLSLLLKANPLIREVTGLQYADLIVLTRNLQLGLYDVVNVLGVAADLSHIATPAKVVGFLHLTMD
ncbi:hypothetical protein DL96DRAFT_1568244 [Flagelloscypha sp. PMI_526]|nr:hypothetical protein DL96DRAFT_1568244 [Flagelloscypha sp. PMI_526]